MQATNFRVGLKYEPTSQFRTTYEGQSNAIHAGADRFKFLDLPAKKTSILLGHAHKNGFVTTNQRNFRTLGTGH